MHEPSLKPRFSDGPRPLHQPLGLSQEPLQRDSVWGTTNLKGSARSAPPLGRRRRQRRQTFGNLGFWRGVPGPQGPQSRFCSASLCGECCRGPRCPGGPACALSVRCVCFFCPFCFPGVSFVCPLCVLCVSFVCPFYAVCVLFCVSLLYPFCVLIVYLLCPLCVPCVFLFCVICVSFVRPFCVICVSCLCFLCASTDQFLIDFSLKSD